MSTISLRLPNYLHDMLRELAQEEEISINQLVVLAIAEKVSALQTESYLAKRAARGIEPSLKQRCQKLPM